MVLEDFLKNVKLIGLIASFLDAFYNYVYHNCDRKLVSPVEFYNIRIAFALSWMLEIGIEYSYSMLILHSPLLSRHSQQTKKKQLVAAVNT